MHERAHALGWILPWHQVRAQRCISTLLTAGSVTEILRILCPFIRRFPRTETGALGKADCCTICSRRPWRVSLQTVLSVASTLREYIDVLDDAAFGAASEVKPKFRSHSDPASQWTAARKEHEDARQVAQNIAKTKQYLVSMRPRKKVAMLFAPLKRVLGIGRLRLRGSCGTNDELLLAATAQNLRKLAKIFPAPQQPRKA